MKCERTQKRKNWKINQSTGKINATHDTTRRVVSLYRVKSHQISTQFTQRRQIMSHHQHHHHSRSKEKKNKVKSTKFTEVKPMMRVVFPSSQINRLPKTEGNNQKSSKETFIPEIINPAIDCMRQVNTYNIALTLILGGRIMIEIGPKANIYRFLVLFSFKLSLIISFTTIKPLP